MTSASDSSRKDNAETAEDCDKEKRKEMENLLKNLPVLNEYFELHNKIGQGTFSTVYLATLRNNASSQKYAVKHLTQACEQSRIENELRCLREIGGKDNVVPAELCLSNGNCVTFIMPYLPHKKFSDYVIDMDAEETSFYMKNLFIALKRVHSFNIIHRDVKPNNFLYDRDTKQFLLVDFGLAQVVRTPHLESCRAAKSKTVDENKPIDYSKKRKRSPDQNEEEKKTQNEGNKRMALKLKDSNLKVSPAPKTTNEGKTELERSGTSTKTHFNSPLKQWTEKPDVDETPVKAKNYSFGSLLPSSRRKLLDLSVSGSLSSPKNDTENWKKQMPSPSSSCLSPSPSGSGNQSKTLKMLKHQSLSSRSKPFPRAIPSPSSYFQLCPCAGKGAVCSLCSSRQPMVAPRAGTSGFRPPEVLFKYLYQTTAVDMWASGVVMLCILSGCYPFFNSSSDLASLTEIMTIFGTEKTINVAKKFGRRIVCSETRKELDLKKLCKRLRSRAARRARGASFRSNEPKCRDCFQAIRADGCLCRSKSKESNEKSGEVEEVESGVPQFPDSAYDLLYRLLDLDPCTRITAAEALEHPFILGRP